MDRRGIFPLLGSYLPKHVYILSVYHSQVIAQVTLTIVCLLGVVCSQASLYVCEVFIARHVALNLSDGIRVMLFLLQAYKLYPTCAIDFSLSLQVLFA